MVDEAVRCLHDKIVEHPWQVDFALTYGIGFPAFRGGLLGWAGRSRGPEQIRGQLELFTKTYGKRFEPSPELSTRSWCAANAA